MVKTCLHGLDDCDLESGALRQPIRFIHVTDDDMEKAHSLEFRTLVCSMGFLLLLLVPGIAS